jgi:OTU domain-containing protein 6
MGKGKKKSGGGGAAAPAGPAMASDETLGSETLDAIEARHELELVEVKKVTAGMTGKKDAMQVLHIEGEVTDRHYLEMRRWEELHESFTDASDDDPVAKSIRDERAASDASGLAANLHAASLNPEPVVNSENQAALNGVTNMTKAMKRRLKRETEERERDARVAREIDEARAAGPSAGEAERSKLDAVLGSRGLRVKEIKADGHCLYRAIADQLETRVPTHAFFKKRGGLSDASDKPTYATLRALAARVMRGEPETYRPFLTPSDCGSSGESREGSREGDGGDGGDGIITDAAWSRYLSDVESTAAWGGQLELQALATGLRVPVEVLTADAPPAVMGEAFLGETDGVALRVCHHRRAFGLGEHYNSAADK